MAEEGNTSPSKLRSLFSSWISTLGIIISIVFLVGEALIIAIDLIGGFKNPYVGILIYIVGPAILVTGLILVPLGWWLEHRRQKRAASVSRHLILDLNDPRQRTRLILVAAVTAFFIMMSMVGSYQAYEVTESVTFCGQVCHQVMTPEFVAYQDSPHAHVDCVACHIGPGADWFVKSKLSGVEQVFAVLFGTYELPIETPVANLRPARETCEECHWPEKFYLSVEKVQTYFGSDDENTPYMVDIMLHVGNREKGAGVKGGIHWHIGLDHTLEYYPTDEDRLEIPWVKVTHDDGREVVFLDESAGGFDPKKMDESKIRVMDCIDCHNRPSHRYSSPELMVNQAMLTGRISPKLPGVKAAVVEALQAEYKTTPEALEAIEKKLRSVFADLVKKDKSKKKLVDKAVKTSTGIYSKNFFPEWKVDWSKYPWHIGHFEFPGCYRCHDDEHKSKDGKVISNDCSLCHTIIRQGEGWEALKTAETKDQEFVHPRGMEDMWQGQNCHECHGPGAM